mmetsp:Transcript_1444/g.2950  ORF Transcript_1444/g.2950 Transcript_1444/m.2950 type:complete len:125 (+) Transcript_1444:996-1370(+)
MEIGIEGVEGTGTGVEGTGLCIVGIPGTGMGGIEDLNAMCDADAAVADVLAEATAPATSLSAPSALPSSPIPSFLSTASAPPSPSHLLWLEPALTPRKRAATFSVGGQQKRLQVSINPHIVYGT